jgi:hypothetical protein
MPTCHWRNWRAKWLALQKRWQPQQHAEVIPIGYICHVLCEDVVVAEVDSLAAGKCVLQGQIHAPIALFR